MVYIKRDPGSRQFGYQIVENNDGAQRILDEEFNNSVFDGPGAVLTFVEQLKGAFLGGRINFGRDKSMGIPQWGYQAYIEGPGGQRQILSEEFGWNSDEEVKSHVNSIRGAIMEGTKTLM